MDTTGETVTELTQVETTRRKPGRPAMDRVCANCLHIRYSDLQVITMQQGACARPKDSGRNGVQAQDTCDHWSRRSTQRRKTDRNRQEVVRVTVAELNARLKGRRRA